MTLRDLRKPKFTNVTKSLIETYNDFRVSIHISLNLLYNNSTKRDNQEAIQLKNKKLFCNNT